MKQIYVNVSVLATLEVPEDWSEEIITDYVQKKANYCIAASEEFNINDIDWS